MGCALGSLDQSLAYIKISCRRTPKGRDIVSRKKSPLGVHLLESITFSFVDQSTPIFWPNVGGVVDDQELFRFLIVDPFRRYSRKKSKVVKNREKFGRFFCRHKFLGAGNVKIVPILSPRPRRTSNNCLHAP